MTHYQNVTLGFRKMADCCHQHSIKASLPPDYCIQSCLTCCISQTRAAQNANNDSLDMEINKRKVLISYPTSQLQGNDSPMLSSRSGELRTQKSKSHLMRTRSLNVLPLKPGVGQYIAMHAALTTRDFFLANFLPFRSIHLHFFHQEFFMCQQWLTPVPVLAVANTGSCGGSHNKIGYPAGRKFPC